MIKVATVCSGIGSPEQALNNLNIPHEISFACEIDKYARQTYLANHAPDIMYEDMTKEEWDLPEQYSDLFIGGIPCQSFSLAGKRLGELDPRGLLFFDFYRYVKNQQPKTFIIENVKGLLSDNKGKTFQNWIQLLGKSLNTQNFMFQHEDSLGYNLHFKVLNSKDYGVPQNRERVFLVGVRADLPNNFTFPVGFSLDKRLKDILESFVDDKYYLSDKMCAGFISKGNAGYINQDTQASQVHDLLGVMPTVSAGTHGYANGYIQEVGKLNSSQDGRVFSVEGISQCVSSGHNNSLKILEPKGGRICGRNPENPKARIAGQYQEQVLEINQDPSISNTLTTVQKDNVIFEPRLILEYNLSGSHESTSRVYSSDGLCPTITAKQGGGHEPKTVQNGRIRRLTPLECFRLQGFPDEFVKPCSGTRYFEAQITHSACPLARQG